VYFANTGVPTKLIDLIVHLFILGLHEDYSLGTECRKYAKNMSHITYVSMYLDVLFLSFISY